MRLRTVHSLRDAANACEEIIGLASQPELAPIDRITALAVERLLLIVGEAMTRIRDDEPNVFDQIPSGPQMIGMRNVIVHGYDVIDWDRIQDAVRDDLPKMLVAVLALHDESGM